MSEEETVYKLTLDQLKKLISGGNQIEIHDFELRDSRDWAYPTLALYTYDDAEDDYCGASDVDTMIIDNFDEDDLNEFIEGKLLAVYADCLTEAQQYDACPILKFIPVDAEGPVAELRWRNGSYGMHDLYLGSTIYPYHVRLYTAMPKDQLISVLKDE